MAFGTKKSQKIWGLNENSGPLININAKLNRLTYVRYTNFLDVFTAQLAPNGLIYLLSTTTSHLSGPIWNSTLCTLYDRKI